MNLNLEYPSNLKILFYLGLSFLFLGLTIYFGLEAATKFKELKQLEYNATLELWLWTIMFVLFDIFAIILTLYSILSFWNFLRIALAKKNKY